MGGRWLPRNVAVDELHRIIGGERQLPGKHVVERDTERIEITTRIDRPIHATRLLRRPIRERSRNRFWHIRRLALARQAGSNAESSEPGSARKENR
jgi:hypothetical protein